MFAFDLEPSTKPSQAREEQLRRRIETRTCQFEDIICAGAGTGKYITTRCKAKGEEEGG